MGKIIEFKKFSKKINKDNLTNDNDNLDILFEDDSVYIRKEIEFRHYEIDPLLNCIYKQLMINDQMIIKLEKNYNLDKLTYIKDFSDKLNDILYFLTNSVYGNFITIKLNFFEFKYLIGTLQLELELLTELDTVQESNSKTSYFQTIKNLYNRLLPSYNYWLKDIIENKRI